MTAHAAAFAPDPAFAPPLITHRVWVLTCTPNDGGDPYYVGWDARDRTVQIKTLWGRPVTYRGRSDQLTPGAFVVIASRADQRRTLVITFQAGNSSLHAVGVNSDGSAGGIDPCVVTAGRD